MTDKINQPHTSDLRPRLTVIGVGGAGSNAVNNMISSGLKGVEFIVANTDAQSLSTSAADLRIQLGVSLTEGLGAGARPEVGEAAAEEAVEEIRARVSNSHMVFVAAGMGGGTGTGAAAVIARVARECGALTVGVVTKPFQFEGSRRMRVADAGIDALRPHVDTLIVIPNQNLFRIANERTTFSEAFVLADQVLYSGIACIVDLIVKDGLINLDFADVRTIMSGMGTAMMGTGEASGEKRAVEAAEAAISNPLLDDISLSGAKGLLVSITGGQDMTLYEVDEAATRVRQEVDAEANIIVGATFDEAMQDRLRVSIVASGMPRLSEQGLAAPPAVAAAGQPALDPAAASAQHRQHASPTGPRAQPALPPGPAPAARPSVQGAGAGVPPLPVRVPDHVREAVDPGSDLSRALSEAISAAAAEAAPHDGGGASVPWTSPTGAVFQEEPRLPPPSSYGRPNHGDGGPRFEQFDPTRDAPPRTPPFRAEPPADIDRSQRRMPGVEDFSPVAQREYHAKAEQYRDHGKSPPRAYQHARQAQPAEPPRKRTLFERLTGVRHHQVPTPAAALRPSYTYPQVQSTVSEGLDTQRRKPVGESRGGEGDAEKNGKESDEIPSFFGGARK
jgi:cell division protein FtsZ